MKQKLKRIQRGVIPYYLSRLFNPKSPNILYYKYIMKHGYSRHLFTFRHEYDHFDVEIQKDVQKDMYFVIHHDKRLYFAISTYHENDDEEVISAFLNTFNCSFVNQKDFFRQKLRSVVLRGKKREG
ncbi:MAG TPA: hypothetical protein DEQ30_14545 [Porphyromonadaceae bacterium]|nr:hypothetical protein [Porphyromonadaceae bacterium]